MRDIGQTGSQCQFRCLRKICGGGRFVSSGVGGALERWPILVSLGFAQLSFIPLRA
jgi:hypothetical protein